MKTFIYSSYEESSKSAAIFIADYVNKKPKSLLSFPSGHSATKTIEYLVQYAKEGRVDFTQCYFVGLDEWIGMNEKNEGSGKHFIYSHMLDPLGIEEKQIILFDGLAENLDDECQRIDEFLQSNGPLDIMIVGIGMNGHIGLNEPGVSFDLYSHHTDLDAITKEVAQKYFSEKTILTRGITLGLRHLMEARVAILLADGDRKAKIVASALEGPVTNNVPSSILQTHPNCFIYLDKKAASQLLSTQSS